MKALSQIQPYASLMQLNEKCYETRGPTFSKQHRGELAIHASDGFPKEFQDRCATEPFYSVLAKHGLDGTLGLKSNLPRGVILCVLDVVAVVRAEELELFPGGPLACFGTRYLNQAEPAKHERAFGIYKYGRVVLITRNVRRLREPVPCTGTLGIWTVPPDVEAAVRLQIATSP